MTLSDLERGHIFLADLRNLRSYRLTENDHIWYGTVTHVAKGVFPGSVTPHPKGRHPTTPNFWSFLHARTCYEKQQLNLTW